MTEGRGQPRRSEKTIEDAHSEIETFVSTERTTMNPEKSSRTPGEKRRSRNSGTV